jgi:CRISPR-associated protein Csb2
MFSIAVDLLSYRYTAMQFNDRNEPEWPPHPARLFSAMTATWADDDEPDPVERDALQWLEMQSPPAIACSDASRRAVVTHFVPVNDPTTLARDVSRTYSLMAAARRVLLDAERSGDDRTVQRARAALAKAEAKAIADANVAGRSGRDASASVAAAALEVLPENRGKQGRTYPTVVPDEATVWFVWPDAAPSEEHRHAIDRLLARVGRVGHSSTLVACRSAISAPSPTWIPGGDGAEKRLRVPRAGLIDRLEVAFRSHLGSEPRLLPAAMVGYRRSSTTLTEPAAPIPLLGGDWFVLGITGRRPPSAGRALDVARAARKALLAHGDQPAPEIVSGHQRPTAGDDSPTPPLDQPHLAVVPLLSAGHPYSDGAVLGIALVLPAHCSEEERSSVERAVRTWSDAGFELLLSGRSGGSSIRQVLEDLGLDRAAGNESSWFDADLAVRRRTTTRGYWCRQARRWLTVTPIALDRFPGNLRSPDQRVRDRADLEAKASIARACSFAGLPGDANVTIRLDSPLSGLPGAPSGRQPGSNGHGRLFPSYQTGSGTPRVCVHAEIVFEVPVRGPVLVGAGRYFGYGLCLPKDVEDGAL